MAMPMLAGMGLGILKSEILDKPKEARERELAATTAALSPWTKMQPQNPAAATSSLEGGLAGAQAAGGLGGAGAPIPTGNAGLASLWGPPSKKKEEDMMLAGDPGVSGMGGVA